MIRTTAAMLTVLLLSGSVANAQTTQPTDLASIEMRAKQAFSRGEYATALPLLQKLVDAYRPDPDKIGPFKEQISVCEKALAAANAQQPAQPVPGGTDPEMSADRRKPHPAPKS